MKRKLRIYWPRPGWLRLQDNKGYAFYTAHLSRHVILVLIDSVTGYMIVPSILCFIAITLAALLNQ